MEYKNKNKSRKQKVQNRKYKIGSTKQEVQNRKYKIEGTKQKVHSTGQEVQGRALTFYFRKLMINAARDYIRVPYVSAIFYGVDQLDR